MRVWAPKLNSVELEVQTVRHRMARNERGWWTTPLELGPEQDYGFILDGEGPLPDPRSSFQPAGVNGLSRSVDHTTFRWTDGGWQAPPLSSGLVYELHVGTFSEEGTFDGVVAHLDHLHPRCDARGADADLRVFRIREGGATTASTCMRRITLTEVLRA
jgi:maltooligosyltrehalose trehalohydrolase